MGRFVAAIVLLLSVPSVTGAVQVPFGTERVIGSGYGTLFAVVAADLNGDGLNDAIAVSEPEDKIVWFENTGGGTFGAERIVSTAADGPLSIHAADVDGDGDLDVLSTSAWDNEVAWYPNDGAGNFAPQRIISDQNDLPNSVWAADLDGDGDMDVVNSSQENNQIAWYRNLDGAGNFGARVVISGGGIGVQPNNVRAADFDRDGDMDVLASSRIDNKVVWYENLNGAGAFSSAHIITIAGHSPSSVSVADVDTDGDPDVVVSSWNDSEIAWYENLDGDGSFGPQLIISTAADRPNEIFAIDLDADGDVDVVSASQDDDKIAWYENLDGSGAFGPQQVISTDALFALSLFVADMDSDGDADVLSGSLDDGEIAWYENETIHRSALFPSEDTASANVYGGRWIAADDIDRDGDVDLVSAAINDDTVRWHENISGNGSSWTDHVISTLADQANSVFIADVDVDGDPDVLSTSNLDSKVAWYENLGGAGAFGPQMVISTAATGPASVFAADVDGDGDPDALSASFFDDKVAWYRNLDAAGNFDLPGIISTGANAAWSVHAADVDGDGDVDALSASRYDDKIAWYENLDGSGSFGPERIVSTNADGARSVFAADIDGDGDIDAISASLNDDTVAWYENTAGDGSSWTERTITTSADYVHTVSASDMDGDGDVDVVSASDAAAGLAWYENVAGDGSTWTAHPVAGAIWGAYSTVAVDVDGDGDMDIASASGFSIDWHENRGGQFALPTVDVAPSEFVDLETFAVFAIDLVHNGRTGDSDIELATLELAFESEAGDPLSDAEVNGLVENLSVWRDDGSGQFEAGSDTLVLTLSTLALVAGLQTVVFDDGDPNVQVAFGAPAKFFVALETAPGATASTPNRFRVTHVTESSSSAEDREHDIPLTLEAASNVTTGLIAAPAPAGAVPDGGPVAGVPLTMGKDLEEGKLILSWGSSCLAGDSEYAIYRGFIGDYASHSSYACGTSGATTAAILPGPSSYYYLIVPLSLNREGSYGTDGELSERPQGFFACAPKSIGACE